MRTEWLSWVRFFIELKQTVLKSWCVKTMGICPSLEIVTKNQNFRAQFRLIDLFLATTVYLPVWQSHCTRARFTVLVSCSDEIADHSCPLLCLQGQVRVARLAFVGQMSEIWPRFKLVVLKNFIWSFGIISSWLALEICLAVWFFFGFFMLKNLPLKENITIPFFSATRNFFDKCCIRLTRHLRSHVGYIWGVRVLK